MSNLPNSTNRLPVPPEIRRACLMLGLKAEELTTEQVIRTWERKLLQEDAANEIDSDTAWFMNAAKDALVIWLDAIR
jgi:hypothetical protein